MMITTDETRFKLFRLLMAKGILEIAFVATLGVGFFYLSFPPHFRGWGEATSHSIAGWAVNESSPWDRVELQLFIDGKFVTNGIANLPRPDVLAAGWSKDEWHGYQFQLPPLSAGVHEARVYAIHSSGGGMRQTLQQVGNPIRFTVNADGTPAPVTAKP